MAETIQTHQAQPGDLVVVEGHRTGESRRIGEILEVLGKPGDAHYRVRWDDEHVSIFFPSSDSLIRPRTERDKP